jgi:phosphatidylglycerophosphate synthase
MRLSPDEVARLRSREHAPTTDASIFARLLQPFWNASLRLVPERVAPNVLTVAGSLVVVGPTALAVLAAPTLRERVPRGLVALEIAAVVLFQLLDALDGKQARRTGTSSPLGSFLDHALDIVTMQLVFVGLLASARSGPGVAAFVLLSGTLVHNFVLHWETGFTRALVLDAGASITDVQVMIVVMHAVALVSDHALSTPIASLAPALAALPGSGATLADAVLVGSVAGLGSLGLVTSFLRGLRAARARGVAAAEALRRLVTIVALTAPAALAVARTADPSARLALMFAFSLGGSHAVGVLVRDNLLGRRPATLQPLAAILGLAGVLVAAAPGLAGLVGPAALALATASVMWFLVDGARTIARALGEDVFTIRRTRDGAG